MHLFYIRNLFTVKLAEEIIKQYKFNECVALVHQSMATYEYNNAYSDSLIKNMDKELWQEIIVDEAYKKTRLIKEVSIPILRSIYNRLIYGIKYKKNYVWYKELLKRLNVLEIYLPNYNSISSDEGLIYLASFKSEIKINKYEEGLSQELIRNGLDPIAGIKIAINKFLDNSLFLESTRIAQFKNGFFENYYTVFPELYPLNNFKNKLKIDLSKFFNPSQTDEFINTYLYLSDPLHEDGHMSLEKEFELIKRISRYQNIIIKFHPRESKEKIDFILNQFDFKTLPNELARLASEDLIARFQFKTIIGTLCTTLFYAEKFTNTPVISYIKWLENKETLKHYQTLMMNHFPRIKLIEPGR